jgi:peptide/nickel transport system permease protein
VAGALGLALVVLTVVFLLFSVLPSDPIRNALGVNASEDAVASLRRELGYDRPLPERYARFIADTARLDFGRSIDTRQAVRPMVTEAMGRTMLIGALALGVAILVSLTLTVVAFLAGRPVERGVVVVCRALTSVPSLIVAIFAGLAVYSLCGGFTGAGVRSSVGIVAALAVYPACSLAEIGVTEASRVRDASFAVAARSLGADEPIVLARCVLPVVLTSWLGQLSNLAATIVVSSTVFEVVFSQPGVGSLMARAVRQNDLPVMQAVALVSVLAFLMVDALFDRVLLPRVAVHVRSTA